MPDNYIVAHNAFSQKILLDPHDAIGKKIMRDGLYDQSGLYFIERVLARLKPAVAFDVGASIGNHALRMTPYCEKVYLFEPQLKIAEVLKRTMSLNQIKNWEICNFGLSNEETTLVLYRNPKSHRETSYVPVLKGRNFVKEESLVCVGDEYVEQQFLNKLDFIKIKVEGFEAKAISGLKNSIQHFRPVVFMEWGKSATKQEFIDLGLFEKIFQDYVIRAVTKNPEEKTLLRKLRGKMKRLLTDDKVKKRRIIGDFLPQQNYSHIILVPKEKEEILIGL